MGASTTLVSVVGARPQFVKLAPIARALNKRDACTHRIAHTGQHYDEEMSASFFQQLEIPTPDINLGVGSASQGAQTAAMLVKLEEYFMGEKPSAVLTYGDTNSTLAATLAAVKLHIPVAHVEAGLRSFNRAMPEEINRLVADHCSDRLYAPTPKAIENLEAENLGNMSILTGDVMLDVMKHNSKLADGKSQVLEQFGVDKHEFGLVTVHRPANTTGDALMLLLNALENVSENHLRLVFPAHPRTQKMLDEMRYKPGAALRIVAPLPYLDIISLMKAATVVITDSGGMQKEAAFLQTPCLTMRDETEWTETVDLGINKLVGNNGSDLVTAISANESPGKLFTNNVSLELKKHYGSGNAADIIVDDCICWISSI